MIQGVKSSADFGIVRMKEVLEHLPDALNYLNSGNIRRSRLLFDILRVVSVGCFFTCKLYLVAWRGGTFRNIDIHPRYATENDDYATPLSYFYIALLLPGDGTPKPPRSRLKTANTARHNLSKEIDR
jgi:hypothetical protein